MQRNKEREDAFHLLLGKVVQSIQGQEPDSYADRSRRMGHVPIIEFVNTLLEEAIRMHASDVHVEPYGGAVRIRCRVDGELIEAHGPVPIQVHAFLLARLKVMAHMDTTEHRLPIDGKILFEPQDGSAPVDIRVSTIPLLAGEKIVLRFLNTSHELLDIRKLAFTPTNERLFRQLCHMPGRMLLACGPVNSGKTTALYAALHELNTVGRNIVTIEDPVEYHLSGINQMQIQPKTGLTFATGLRAILRQDPDVVMLGEIRDEETAGIAVRAALTGHQLFSTLHTRQAVGAVFRLLDMGVAPYLLAASLGGVLAQRLVRRICPVCSTAYPVTGTAMEKLLLPQLEGGQQLYRGCGCSACHGTGYQGRLALHELLAMDREWQAAILQRRPLVYMEELQVSKGIRTLAQDGVEKALLGLTTLEEVARVIYGEFCADGMAGNFAAGL